MKKLRPTKNSGSKTFKEGLNELVKFAQGKNAKVKVETLVINSKGHDVKGSIAST